MDLLNCLKYILPLTILFDAVVSVSLIRKSLQDKIIRYYGLALFTLVIWEVFFWLSIFTNYHPLENSTIDRLAFVAALASQYLMLQFLLNYLKINFSKTLKHLILIIVLTICVVILVFGVGDRQYLGEEPHQYYLGSGSYSSIVLTIYSFISVSVAALCFYPLAKMIAGGLSALEIARRKLIRNSIVFSLLVTLIPLTILPLTVLLTGGRSSEMLASDWYIAIIVLAAIFSSVWTATTAYALTRYRLFDVTVRIRRSIILMAGVLILTISIILIDQLLLKEFFDDTAQAIALFVLLVSGFVIVIWSVKKVGFGEALSFALAEPVQPNTTTRELVEKLQHYLNDEFSIIVHSTYLFDITAKQFAHSDTGLTINLSSELVDLLKQNLIIRKQLPQALKPAVALVPLTYNGFLVGFTAVTQNVEGEIQKNIQPFVGLIYQTMFANYLKSV